MYDVSAKVKTHANVEIGSVKVRSSKKCRTPFLGVGESVSVKGFL